MTVKSEMQGNRDDLAQFLRKSRRALGLKRSDVWQDNTIPVHTFTASKPVFLNPWLNRPTHIFDFQIFPF